MPCTERKRFVSSTKRIVNKIIGKIGHLHDGIFYNNDQ